MSGGFDLSVGPLTGLAVIVLSLSAVPGAREPRSRWILAVIADRAGLRPRQRIARPVGPAEPGHRDPGDVHRAPGHRPVPPAEAGGLIDRSVVALLKTAVGPIPLAFLVVVAIGLRAEVVLRRTRAGLELRAVGSDALRAHRLGARVRATRIGAVRRLFICSRSSAGSCSRRRSGIGDASLGTSYSLTSITAVVLGGASIFGGRGSFIGALLGALLLQEIITATAFLRPGRRLAVLAAGRPHPARGRRLLTGARLRRAAAFEAADAAPSPSHPSKIGENPKKTQDPLGVLGGNAGAASFRPSRRPGRPDRAGYRRRAGAAGSVRGDVTPSRSTWPGPPGSRPPWPTSAR